MSKPVDFKVKTQKPNHLASSVEKWSSAGATIPRSVAKQHAKLATLTALAKTLLSPILGDELALASEVVYSKDDLISIALPTMTAVNHARFLHKPCLDALQAHESFAVYQQIHFVCAYKSTPNHHHPMDKKPLSENTKLTITQYADVVITDQNLLKSVHRLMQNAKVVDEHDPS